MMKFVSKRGEFWVARGAVKYIEASEVARKIFLNLGQCVICVEPSSGTFPEIQAAVERWLNQEPEAPQGSYATVEAANMVMLPVVIQQMPPQNGIVLART